MGARMVTITVISTGQRIIMTDSDAYLTLAQWFSPSFPIGAFSYSHGLETAILDGHVKSAADLTVWVADVLVHGTGRNDVILLATSYAADPADLTALDELARALAPTQERLLEAVQQGAAFARTVRDVWGHDLPDMVLPLVVGAAAARQGLPLALTADLYLHGFASNLVSAAVRLVPLGQTEGQACLLDLKPTIKRIAAQALSLSIDDLGAATFAADICAARHETQYARIFRS